MRLSIRDGTGTVFTALASVYGIAFLYGADVPLAPSSRIAALVVFLLAWAACSASGSEAAMTEHMSAPAVMLLSTLGVAALVFALIAIVADSMVMLTALVAVTLAMWVLTTLRHAATQAPGPPLRAAGGSPA